MSISIRDLEEQDPIVAEINITPLTDIFLVLLIIFMISSSAMIESGFQVKLPSTKASSPSSPKKTTPIYLTLDNKGKIAVNTTEVQWKELAKTLKEALDKTEEKTVMIRGDESILLGKVVEIMEISRTAGAEKIAVATQEQGTKK